MSQHRDGDLRVLVADSDPFYVASLARRLAADGFEVHQAATAEEAMRMLVTLDPDLLLLDLVAPTPGTTGFQLCAQARRRSSLPIIVLSDSDEEGSAVRSLELGADDYVVKSCGDREFVARLRAVLRRADRRSNERVEPPELLADGDLALDPDSHDAWIRGERVALPHKEFQVLHLLLRNKGKVVGRRRLLHEIDAGSGAGRSLHTHIRRLRARIEIDPSRPVRILSARGLGYKLELSERLELLSESRSTAPIVADLPRPSTCSAT